MADSYHPMTTNTNNIYRPLNAEDVHALKFIAISQALDLALYGTCSNNAVLSLCLMSSMSRYADGTVYRGTHYSGVHDHIVLDKCGSNHI